MRLEGQRESGNVEDRRGGGFRGGAGLGLGGVLLVLVIALVTGKDPMRLLQLLQGAGPVQEQTGSGAGGPPADDRLSRFASVVLASTEDTWTAVFAESGLHYEVPRLVLFDGSVASACGHTSSAVGPFYCAADRKVYLDLSFFSELARRFGAPGDFAQAYVISHEVGHHVQTLLGIQGQVSSAQEAARSEAQANRLSVALELQADCLAGVWANRANRATKILEPGDIEEGLRAAAAIGDDRLQSLGQGYVQPESWTHGSSEQRVEWLRRGLESGDPNACKTL
jgi:predicted metalloprotease